MASVTVTNNIVNSNFFQVYFTNLDLFFFFKANKTPFDSHVVHSVLPPEMDLDTFFRAVQEGDAQTVRRGLEAGVDVNAKRYWLRVRMLIFIDQTKGGESSEISILIYVINILME